MRAGLFALVIVLGSNAVMAQAPNASKDQNSNILWFKCSSKITSSTNKTSRVNQRAEDLIFRFNSSSVKLHMYLLDGRFAPYETRLEQGTLLAEMAGDSTKTVLRINRRTLFFYGRLDSVEEGTIEYAGSCSMIDDPSTDPRKF